MTCLSAPLRALSLSTLYLSLMFTITLGGTSILPSLSQADEQLFSGPQVGEPLPAFKALHVKGEDKGKAFDIIADAGQEPVVLIFFHKLTRPAFGMSINMLNYALSKADKPLHSAVILLTDDVNTPMNPRAVEYFPAGGRVGVSPDGIEGPGAYGLNRNVTLTVLVGKEGKVTANFALVQPSLPADGPKILTAIADVIGEEPPSIEELQQQRQTMNARMRGQTNEKKRDRSGQPKTQPDRNSDAGASSKSATEDKLSSMLRMLVQAKDASKEEVAKEVAAIESYVAQDKAALSSLLSRSKRIVDADIVERYGNEHVQAAIRKWAKQADSQD